MDKKNLDYLEMDHELQNLMQTWVNKKINPLVMAGLLTSTALRVYRTVLTEKDYENVVDTISKSRSKIKKFDLNVAARRLH